jgi:hypothetical protein
MNSSFTAARLDNIDFDAEPSVEEVLQYLEWLMRWYCREPSMLLATIIVSRLEWLREHEQECDSQAPEWSCSRLIRNWEYLARSRRGK